MVAPNEITALVLSLCAAALVISVFRKERMPGFGIVYLAFFFVVCASFSTLVEGLLWYDFFNTIEHASFAVAGILFAVAALRMLKGDGEGTGR